MDPAPVTDRTEPAGPGTGIATGPPLAERQPTSGCPVPHGATITESPLAEAPGAGSTTHGSATQGSATRCPSPHGGAATDPAATATADGATCPIMHGGDPGGRSKADLLVRRVLRIPERPADDSEATLYRGFQRSMLISATRCTLTYVVFPFLLPFLHFLKGGAPVIGILVGVVALVADTYTIRRFFAFDHKWRWYFSALVFAVMGLMAVLLVQDVGELVTHLS